MDQHPKIPTLKDAQKPQVKIKGLGAGLTLLDRLKQFKKKDLAFILAGLGTLFMAPLAEHFMMAPETGDEQLQQGWGSGTGRKLFGGGDSPYENGNNNIASGGAIGGSGDIITPLNVRDPSSLVMGPSQAQQPPAGSAAPATPPTAAARSETDYKDALAGAAARAAGAAVKKSALPVPKVALGGSGLRGLGVVSGGTSASSGLGPPAGAGGGTAGTGGGGLNLVRSSPGFKGAAGPRGPNSPSGIDGTKRAGQNAGDAFSRTGDALGGLKAAAGEQIPSGGAGSGGGGLGAGADGKAPGGSGAGGSKSIGESLAFLEMKQRMEENLKLEFEKRRLKDPELLLYGIRNDSLKAMASEMTKSLAKAVLGFMDPDTSKNYKCKGSTTEAPFVIPGPPVGAACPEKENGRKGCIEKLPNSHYNVYNDAGAITMSCAPTGDPDDPVKVPGAEDAPTTPPGGGVVGGWPTGPGRAAADRLDATCARLKAVIGLPAGAAGSPTPDQLVALKAMQTQLAIVVSARDALYGTSATGSCGATDLRQGKSVYGYQDEVIRTLLGANGVPALQELAVLETKVDGDVKAKVQAQATIIAAARESFNKATPLLDAAKTELEKVQRGGVQNAALDATEFTERSASAVSALTWLKDTYVPAEGLLLARLDPLVKGAEYAAKIDPPLTIPAVIGANNKYIDMKTAAAKVSVTPDETVTAPAQPAAPTDPRAAADAVAAAAVGTQPGSATSKIDAANTALAALTAANAALAAAVDPAARAAAQAEVDRAKNNAQTAVNEAYLARGSMRQKQTGVLSVVSGGLYDIKDGR